MIVVTKIDRKAGTKVVLHIKEGRDPMVALALAIDHLGHCISPEEDARQAKVFADIAKRGEVSRAARRKAW